MLCVVISNTPIRFPSHWINKLQLLLRNLLGSPLSDKAQRALLLAVLSVFVI